VFALSGLGGENDLSRVKMGDGIKKFEKHCCRLSSRFTFCPRLLFRVARATAYQAVRYTAGIM